MAPQARSTMLLRLVLLIAGLVMVLLGANVGLGGIRTLGVQGPTDFLSVTDAAAFAAQDSHVRFLGGFWLCAGLIVVAGAFALQRLHAALITIAVMAFAGGVVRFSAIDLEALNPAALASSPVLGPLLAELVFYPILAVWLLRHGSADRVTTSFP